MRIVNVAIDSMPLVNNAAAARDHSSHIVYAQTHLPLVFADSLLKSPEPMAATRYETSTDGKKHYFYIKKHLRWSDGTCITPADFAAAISRVRNSKTAEAVWLRDIDGLKIKGQAIEMGTRQANYLVPYWMGLLALCLERTSGVGAGQYVLEQKQESEILIKRNPFYESREDSAEWIRFIHIKDPQDNVDAFYRGRVDVTADTAFPYSLVSSSLGEPTFSRTRIGLRAALAFEGMMTGPELFSLRKWIASVIDRKMISDLLYGIPIPSTHFASLPSDQFLPQQVFEEPIDVTHPSRALVLAFDDYYPNREICEALAAQLRACGLPTKLVADRYGAPCVSADMRFVLLKGILPGELSIYFGLMFNAVLRQSRDIHERYVAALSRFTQAPHRTARLLNETIRLLQKFLDEVQAIIPLFELPGLLHSRLTGNPQCFSRPGEVIA